MNRQETKRYLLLLVAMLASGIFLYFSRPEESLTTLLWTSIVAALTWALAFQLPGHEEWMRHVPSESSSSSSLRTRIVGWAALVGVLAASLMLFSRWEEGSGAACILYALALLLIIWLAREAPAGSGGIPVQSWEVKWLIAILGVACLFRFHLLQTLPYGAWFDEAQNTIVSMRIWNEWAYKPPFVADLSQLPALLFYYSTPFAVFFGNNVLGVRVAATLGGLAAIVATWALCRELFGKHAALLAALILALMRWHVNFSRFGMAQIFTTLFLPLSLFFFVKSQRRTSTRDAILSGVSLGLGLQTYYSMLAAPVLCIVTWVFLSVRRKAGIRSFWLLALTLLVTTLVYSPIIEYGFTHWTQFTERFATVGKMSPMIIYHAYDNPTQENLEAYNALVQTALKHFKMFTIIGDGNGRHNLPGTPMLDPLTGMLFAIGFLWCLMRCLDPRYFLLLLWFAVSLSGGIFSLDFEAPQGGRTIGITPLLAILAALPLVRLRAFMTRIGEGKARLALRYAIFAGVFIFIAGHNWHTYFNRQLYNPGAWAAWSTPETRIAKLVKQYGQDNLIYVPEPLVGGPTEKLLAGDLSSLKPFQRATDLPLSANGKGAILFIEVHEDDVLKEVKRLYPEARLEAFGAPLPTGGQAGPIFWIAHISAAQIEHINGMKMTRVRPDGTQTTTVIHEPKITWSEQTSSITVRAMLRAPQTGPYTFGSTGPGRFSITIDRTPIKDGDSKLLPTRVLAQGNHLIELTLIPHQASGEVELDWHAGAGIKNEAMNLSSVFLPEVYEGGLLAEFFSGLGTKGTPKKVEIDSQVAYYFHRLPLDRPFSIRWSGEILIPETGRYEFGSKGIDDTILVIDGTEILHNKSIAQYESVTISLESGWHSLVFSYDAERNYNQVYLYWRRLNSGALEPELIPPAFLRPPVLRANKQ